MAKVPAIKRRKLTPPEIHGEESSPSALENAPNSNAFFKTASKWNLEQDYETRPRKGKKEKKESTRLPIKTKEGLVQQVEAPVEVDEEESNLEWIGADDIEEDEAVEEKVEEKPSVPARQQILEAKEELARIALMLNEDPEGNVGAFRAIAEFGKLTNITIKKLALATQLAVYKDVIPGYRIRPLSEDNMEEKVSKEVRKLRAYEQALVGGYQGYVKELARLATSGRTHNTSDGGAGLQTIAINCACALLEAVPHFNFRSDLLKILVGKLSTRKVDNEFIKCRETIETLFKNDDDGTSSLDAVNIITKMMKGRGYRVDESVLNTFLHLRLLSEFSGKASTNHVDHEEDSFGGKKLKEKRVFRTKKERKLMKERKAVEKEMVQADATVSHEDRERMQSETLKLVFVTYFRILKVRSPSLMGAVLEGLARYAHLINQDFFGDLLEALKDLIGHAETGDDLEETEAEDEDSETSRNLTREALLCIITAFALLEGQDAHKAKASLSLDLSYFITHLYRTLHALSLNPDIELSSKSLHIPDPNAPSTTDNKINIQTTTVLLLRSLSSVLLPPLAARAVPPLRIAAFTKQLMTCSLQLPEKSATAMVSLLGKVTKIHETKVKSLWNTEERKGDGKFDGCSVEVEGSNPMASTIWEGELLRLHYCPAVKEGVMTMEKNVIGLR